MYLHIIYKNGEKGGIDLTGKESFVISDNFDSDISALDVINEKKDNFGKALVQLLSQLRPR